LNIVFYLAWGLTGLAFSFALGYLLYFFAVNVIAFKRYSFSYSTNLRTVLLPCFIFFLSVLFIISFSIKINHYVFSIPVSVGCICFSLSELNKRLGLVSLIRSRFNL